MSTVTNTLKPFNPISEFTTIDSDQDPVETATTVTEDNLWAAYPPLFSYTDELYSDPFADSHLDDKQELPFRTLMLEHKHKLDSLFKSLSQKNTWESNHSVRVNYFVMDTMECLEEYQAACDLVDVFLTLST